MIIISVFVLLVFLYSLVSRRLEQTVITAPIVFTTAGILLILAMPGLREMNLEKESFLTLAEVGLVMLLFTDATHVNLKTLRSKERLPLRLLSIGMLLTIILGAIGARIVFPDVVFMGSRHPCLHPCSDRCRTGAGHCTEPAGAVADPAVPGRGSRT